MAFTRVYVMREFSYERGGMRNLAYIGATLLNFGLAWPADVWPAQNSNLRRQYMHSSIYDG